MKDLFPRCLKMLGKNKQNNIYTGEERAIQVKKKSQGLL